MNILIASYSKSYDIWHITDYFLEKNWKNNNLKVYLGANGHDKQKYCPKSWIYINKGEDKSFSQSLNSYLEEIKEEYFILMLDDFLILEKVNNYLINKAFEFIKENKGVYLKLAPNPKGDFKIDKYFSQIDVKNEAPYITSLQMAMWKKDFLIKLLKYDFNPWEFEVKAGKTKEALENSDKFFVTTFPFVKYIHFVEKGKFFPFIKELIQKENLQLIGNRSFWKEEELIQFRDSNIEKIKKFIKSIIPNRYINNIRRLMRKRNYNC